MMRNCLNAYIFSLINTLKDSDTKRVRHCLEWHDTKPLGSNPRGMLDAGPGGPQH